MRGYIIHEPTAPELFTWPVTSQSGATVAYVRVDPLTLVPTLYDRHNRDQMGVMIHESGYPTVDGHAVLKAFAAYLYRFWMGSQPLPEDGAA
jgi:hypothetical protein